MQNKLRLYWPLLAWALPALLIDLASKIWVRQNILFGRVGIGIGPIRVVNVGNAGAGGGLLANAPLLLSLLALVISLAVIAVYPRLAGRSHWMPVALGLLLGGGLGNLIDRLALGYVTDFIAIGSLPIFNLADVWVLVGVCLLALILA
jgi:signal peptidase II